MFQANSSSYAKFQSPLFQSIMCVRLVSICGCSMRARGKTLSSPCIMCVQYIGGYHKYIGGYHEYIGGYHEYIGGYHEHIGGYHEYIRGYHEYIRGCSVHRGDIMMHVGDIMMNVGDIMRTLGDVQYIRVFSINQRLLSTSSLT